mgnify:CR=1 FL=1
MTKTKPIFIRYPRLEMPLLGRFFIRIISAVVYGLLIAGAVSGLISDVPRLRWLGLLLAIFVIDLFLHRHLAPRNLLNEELSGNLVDFLTPSARRLLERALDKTAISGGPIMIRLAEELSDHRDIIEIFSRLEINRSQFESHISHAVDRSPSRPAPAAARSALFAVIPAAAVSARASDSAGIKPGHLFTGLLESGDEDISRLRREFSLSADSASRAIYWLEARDRLSRLRSIPATVGGFAGHSFNIRPRVINRAWTSRPTPTLDRYSLDLTALARRETVGLLVGHRREYDELANILSKPGFHNALLVGRPGAGKTTILAHLAFRIVKDKVPSPLFDKRLVSLNLSSLVAGASDNEVQERLRHIVSEIVKSGNIILVIDNIHNLLKTESASALNAADALVPVISSDSVSVIGTTTPSDRRLLASRGSEFNDLFSEIKVEEISPTEAETILVFFSIVLENRYRRRFRITLPGVSSAVNIARRYLTDRPLPGSALDLLEEAATDAITKDIDTIGADAVISIAEHKINIPLRSVGVPEAAYLLKLEATIHQTLVDQEEAVSAISSSLRRYRSGLTTAANPIASFLFVGPTGVGKTELAKIIAEVVFGSRQNMIRLDMSEFQTRESYYRLVGSPDGSVSGSLTDAVSAKPYALILLDEFEKAHADVLNLFLQVLDDGRLTDSLGRTVKFEDTIIIATSNAHSAAVKEQLDRGVSIDTIAVDLKSKLTAYFRPELLNRFSRIIVFRPLSQPDITVIAQRKLERLSADLEASSGIAVSFTPAAVAEVGRLGFDESFGARPLETAIDEHVRNPLAEAILKNNFTRGDTVSVDLDNGRLKISVVKL